MYNETIKMETFNNTANLAEAMWKKHGFFIVETELEINCGNGDFRPVIEFEMIMDSDYLELHNDCN